MAIDGAAASGRTAKTSPQKRSFTLVNGLPAGVPVVGSKPLAKIKKSLLHEPWAASWLKPAVAPLML